MKIYVGFYGTCVHYSYPKRNRDIGSARVLKKLIKNGHQIFLFYTAEDEKEFGFVVSKAEEWFKKKRVELSGVVTDKEKPAFNRGFLYAEDKSIPLALTRSDLSEMWYICWNNTEMFLEREGLLKETE